MIGSHEAVELMERGAMRFWWTCAGIRGAGSRAIGRRRDAARWLGELILVLKRQDLRTDGVGMMNCIENCCDFGRAD